MPFTHHGYTALFCARRQFQLPDYLVSLRRCRDYLRIGYAPVTLDILLPHLTLDSHVLPFYARTPAFTAVALPDAGLRTLRCLCHYACHRGCRCAAPPPGVTAARGSLPFYHFTPAPLCALFRIGPHCHSTSLFCTLVCPG